MIVGALLGAAAAVVGALLGAALHELTHIVAALAVGGRVETLRWRGGLAGGPVVEWRSPDGRGWRPRFVGLAPALVGLLAALTLLVRRPDGLGFFVAFGAVAALLWGSPEDFSVARARKTASD